MKANAFLCVRTNLDMIMKIVVAMGGVEKQVYFLLLQKVRQGRRKMKRCRGAMTSLIIVTTVLLECIYLQPS